MRRVAPLLCAALLAAACGEPSTSAPPAVGESRDYAIVVSADLAPATSLGTELRQVAVAAGREGWLVVWSRPGPAGEDLVGLRVAPSGEPLDAAPFVISDANGDEQWPAVAFDGEQWLVAWQDHRVGPLMNVYAARVTQAGQVLDPAGIPVCTREEHQRSPAVAFLDGVFVVVWQDRRAITEWDVYGARVSRDGVVLDPGGFVVSAAPGHQIAPAIAAGGGVALATWQGGSIHGARLTAAGAVLDPGAGLTIASASAVQANPAVAFDGASFVVAWQDHRAGLEPDVYAARVTPSGGLLDAAGRKVAGGPLGEYAPAVTFDVRHALVAWASGTAGAATAVEGTRLDAAADVQDVPGFAIASGALGRSLALAADGGGRVLVVHDALDDLGAVTLRGRVLTTWARLDVARAGRGGGAVTSVPAGVECGETCSAAFDGGATVTLTATPDGDSVFGGWSGACAGTGACTVTMSEARRVTATFLPLLPVDVTIAGAAGSVTSEPPGVACPATCSARFPEGTAVRLVPAGTPGTSVFSAWSEDCSGADCAIVVDAPRRATASFVAARTLTLNLSGAGRGVLAAGGISCATGSSCPFDLALGSTATVTATPDAATSILKAWTGCTTSSGPTCSVSMTATRTVTGRFEPSTYPLTVAVSVPNAGAGSVSGPGVACSSGSTDGCRADVENPPYTTAFASVSLRASPAEGSVFKAWTGCIAVTGDPTACSVSMSMARSVTARFEGATIPLTATATGTGAGAITGGGLDCPTGGGAGCTAAVPNPALVTSYTTVTLRAAPAAGSVFKAWTGCTPVSGDPSACTIAVSAPRTVSAKFEPETLPVTATPSGAGQGTIAGAGLACTTGSAEGCTAAVPNPANSATYTTVSLRAEPVEGSVFKAWTTCPAVPGAPRSCALLVNGPKTIGARFEPSTLPLSAAFTGTGAGRITGGGLACEKGVAEGCTAAVPNPADVTTYTTVLLRAAPFDGSVFKSWTGCTAVAGDPTACTVLVSSARAVSAKFEPAMLPVTIRSSGGGGGTVSGPGFTCAATAEGCTVEVANPADSPTYSTIVLSASPDATSLLKGWTGCTPLADPTTCSLRVDGVESVTARLEPDEYLLTVRPSGSGRVEGPGIACSAETTDGCTAPQPNGAAVRLVAAPADGWILKGWVGCTANADGSCTVSMTAARTVTATFQPAAYPLTLQLLGTGSGAIEGDATCAAPSGGSCTVDVPNGATVKLVASPAAGSTFTGWSGSCYGTGACTVTMSMARTVRASFGSP